jgi:hypothetical protein
MKALIYNHHPDYIWQLQSALEYLNIDCYIATEELTFKSGADYSSTASDFKMRKGPIWYSEDELFEPGTFKYSNTIDGMDYVFAMHRDIVKKIDFDKNKLFFCACVSWDLEGMQDFTKYTKITSHHNANFYGAKHIPYFVPQKGELKTKTYITQLMEAYDTSPYLNELMELKKNNYPIVIAGSYDAPDGIVDDWQALQHTTLLVHHKGHGTNCNAVMKALDTGIPVYISRENKEQTGMADLPDELFLYSNDMRVYEAYEKSLTINNKQIQATFRNIRNVKNTSNNLKLIL